MSGNINKLIAFNYFGGKFTWLKHIYENFPSSFNHLAEVFGGSAVVSINYRKKGIITVNEINSDITNFFEVLRDHPEELIAKLLFTPCSKTEFDRCWEYTPEPVENARRFYVRVRQSFFGLGAQRKNKGWHMAVKHLNANRGETVSKWKNAVNKLSEVAFVLRDNIQFTNFDYKDFINKIDSSDTFFYEDPPYVESVRASKNDYKFEFSTNDHIDLADINNKLKAKVMISGYDSDLYSEELYKDWRKVKFPVKKNNIRSGNVQEVIWMNYDEEITHKHLTFFNEEHEYDTIRI